MGLQRKKDMLNIFVYKTFKENEMSQILLIIENQLYIIWDLP